MKPASAVEQADKTTPIPGSPMDTFTQNSGSGAVEGHVSPQANIQRAAAQGAALGESENNTASTGETVQVGRATTIQKPYDGETPVYVKPENSTRPLLSTGSVTTAQTEIEQAQQLAQQTGKSFRNFITDTYEKLFQESGGQRGVAVDGLTMDGKPYVVRSIKAPAERSSPIKIFRPKNWRFGT